MAFPPRALAPSELVALRAVEIAGQPFVAFRDGTGELRTTALEGDRVTIGRAAGNEVSLPWDPQVSRVHAQLDLIAGAWFLSDDGMSRNGCFVDGERVQGRVRLDDGASVRLGNSLLLFRQPGEGSETTIAASASALVRITDSERRVLVALCRPILGPGSASSPASNREIADGLGLSPAGIKTHLRVLFEKLEVEDLPQNRKRAALAQRAIDSGMVSVRDLREAE